MAILLISTFYPGSIGSKNEIGAKNEIGKDKKILFFLFGVILLVTAKWETLFKEPVEFSELQQILGRSVSR
jgi:hypothetical protein